MYLPGPAAHNIMFFGLPRSLNAVFTRFCESVRSFSIFLIVLAATLLQNGRWQKHQGFLLKSLLKSYVFGASMWGDTQDRFTPIGKADYLAPEACVAVSACFCEYRVSFYSFLAAHLPKMRKLCFWKGPIITKLQ